MGRGERAAADGFAHVFGRRRGLGISLLGTSLGTHSARELDRLVACARDGDLDEAMAELEGCREELGDPASHPHLARLGRAVARRALDDTRDERWEGVRWLAASVGAGEPRGAAKGVIELRATPDPWFLHVWPGGEEAGPGQFPGTAPADLGHSLCGLDLSRDVRFHRATRGVWRRAAQGEGARGSAQRRLVICEECSRLAGQSVAADMEDDDRALLFRPEAEAAFEARALEGALSCVREAPSAQVLRSALTGLSFDLGLTAVAQECAREGAWAVERIFDSQGAAGRDLSRWLLREEGREADESPSHSDWGRWSALMGEDSWRKALCAAQVPNQGALVASHVHQRILHAIEAARAPVSAA